MASTSSLGATAPVGAAANAASSAAAAGDDATSDRFLTLLVTQLKNQDPLNPLDNAQITSQLAQLSTVNGINQLNSTLSTLSASFDAKQYLQAASLVGHDVIADGNGFALANGAGTGAFELAGDADAVTVTITDAAGAAVRRLDLGAQTAGVTSFTWDGRNDAGGAVPDGRFKLSVTATKAGASVTATPLAVGEVTGIVPGAGGGSLQVTGLGKIDLGAVREIGSAAPRPIRKERP